MVNIENGCIDDSVTGVDAFHRDAILWMAKAMDRFLQVGSRMDFIKGFIGYVKVKKVHVNKVRYVTHYIVDRVDMVRLSSYLCLNLALRLRKCIDKFNDGVSKMDYRFTALVNSKIRLLQSEVNTPSLIAEVMPTVKPSTMIMMGMTRLRENAQPRKLEAFQLGPNEIEGFVKVRYPNTEAMHLKFAKRLDMIYMYGKKDEYCFRILGQQNVMVKSSNHPLSMNVVVQNYANY